VRVTSVSPNRQDAGVSEPVAHADREVESVEDGQTIRVIRRRSLLADFGVCTALSAAAMIITHGLLMRPTTRALDLNPTDQALLEWMLALGSRFWTGDLHLVTHLLNAPDGVNLLSNASVLVLGVILAPVTLMFGAPTSFAVAVTANLAATAIGWYLLFARTLRLRRAAAATGAAFCAYAPGMISQSNAHLHMTAQWLVPVIVWCVIRLARTPAALPPARWVRRVTATGLLLGAVVSVQLFLGEEVLLLAAITLALFCAAYALAAPRRAARALRPLAVGLAAAVAVSLVALAFPLQLQFAGPQHVPNGPFAPEIFGADLRGFWSISPLSWDGSPAQARLATGPAEYNSFFGVPLLVLVVAATVWLWRRPVVLAAMTAGLVMAALAIGPQVNVGGSATGRAGPYRWLTGLPVLDAALPTRFALALIPIFALVLATALDRALRDPRRAVRLAVPAAVALALLPLVPAPLPTFDRAPVPRFFADGHWRQCVRPGGTLVPVPLPRPTAPDKMRWAAAANAAFAIPEGFFIGPYASGGRASLGIYSRPTSQLLNEVERTGAVPTISDTERAQARRDVAYWRASCLVVADHQINGRELRATMEGLFGAGQEVADVHVWRVSG
jgi:hypothetical protein